ncbi:MAG: 50S ribosomal protein L9 [Bacteroidaceae bacterium]|nr:50S ribosomal protein L9 [Bacteroidaceae bacterium]MBR5964069.1 50S ribosomal protein L9 [Bacteroidaceae bacterium]
MQIILIEDVQNLGYKNDIVTVKDGYARNYLIPQHKAILATESAKKVLAENLRQRAHKLAKIKQDAEALASRLEPLSLTIAAKVSEAGTLYAAVGAAQVAAELGKQGYDVDVKTITVNEPAKELGHYTATVRLHKEVAVEVPFEVVAEGAEAAEAAEAAAE